MGACERAARDPPAAAAAPAPRWELVRDRHAIRSGDTTRELHLDAGDQPERIIELDGELAIVVVRLDDPYDELVRYDSRCIDLATGTTRFVVGHGCRAAARFGDRVYTSATGRYTAHSVDGVALGRGRLVGEGLVFASDGTFATRADGVIRIWHPDQLRLGGIEPAYERGLLALSPDSTHAITGQVLCDARTGETLAQVEFSGLGNWLEGGPPRNCRALCDEVLGEILPFGYRLWDSTTGELLVDDRDHRAGPRDVVAFAPDGRVHAILHGNTLGVYDNYSLRLLHEATVAVASTWLTSVVFSRDGSTLWWGERAGALHPIEIRPHGHPDLVANRPAQIRDGLVTLGGLMLPIDDGHAVVSEDGHAVLGWHGHYVRR